MDLEETAHILVVDDDERLLELLCRFLREQGFAVSTANSADAARKHLDSLVFDAIVLDIMMPGESGLEFTSRLRQTEPVPILLLSAKGEIEDRIKGLELGADDYLPKPFEPRELVARIKSVLRRTPPETGTGLPAQISFGPYRFDFDRLELQHGQETVRLAPIEQHLLIQLLRAAGGVVDRESLAGSAPVPSSPRSIDVQIGRLRKKIEADPRQPHYIHTVRGQGYRLTVPRP